MIRILLRFVPVVAAATLAAACSSAAAPDESGASGPPKPGGTLTVAISSQPKVLNTNYVYDGQAYYINSNIYSKLVRSDFNTGKLYGDLASSWKASTDLKTYTFELKPNLKWSDGKDLTVDDVVWTFKDILRAGRSAYTYNLYSDVQSVEASGASSVVFNLKAPNALFVDKIADYYGANILPEHIYSTGDPVANPDATKPVGSGPFTFDSQSEGQSLTLKRNDSYYGHKAMLDKVIFRIFPSRDTAIAAVRAGEVQYSTISPAFGLLPSLEKASGVKVVKTDSDIMQWFAFNLDNQYLAKKDVRFAIAHAIDVKQLATQVYAGRAEPAAGQMLSYLDAFDAAAKQPEFDAAKANQLLDAAGYPKKADGWRFKLRYSAWSTQVYGGPELGKVIKQQLAAVGIDVDLQVQDFALFNEQVQKKRDFDMTGSGGLQGPDPSLLRNFIGTGGGRNVMGYSNPQIDKLFVEASQTADVGKRNQAYKQIQVLVAQDMPRMNLVEYPYWQLFRSTVHQLFWEKHGPDDNVSRDTYNYVWVGQ